MFKVTPIEQLRSYRISGPQFEVEYDGLVVMLLDFRFGGYKTFFMLSLAETKI